MQQRNERSTLLIGLFFVWIMAKRLAEQDLRKLNEDASGEENADTLNELGAKVSDAGDEVKLADPHRCRGDVDGRLKATLAEWEKTPDPLPVLLEWAVGQV